MKRLIITLCVISLSLPETMKAQMFEKGTHIISPGFGMGGIYPVFTSVNSRSPLFGLSYEHSPFENAGPGTIGIGGFIGYKAFKRNNEIGDNRFYEKLHYVIIGAKGAYHYNPFRDVENLDLYAGLMLSLNIPDYANNYSENYKYLENKYRPYLAGTIYAGARYFFTENIGVFVEAGFGTSFLNLGVNFKF